MDRTIKILILHSIVLSILVKQFTTMNIQEPIKHFKQSNEVETDILYNDETSDSLDHKIRSSRSNDDSKFEKFKRVLFKIIDFFDGFQDHLIRTQINVNHKEYDFPRPYARPSSK
ncbi:unnamed protein product [Brachionus calyciflorus]|uniref:Uncharacterized protein n=1 Tax=Brachionus calyciflorus TaxID=104777 RepID=A0A814JFP3_9BILA|nr:unnamed protein product [Brachionus calyciflorus]